MKRLFPSITIPDDGAVYRSFNKCGRRRTAASSSAVPPLSQEEGSSGSSGSSREYDCGDCFDQFIVDFVDAPGCSFSSSVFIPDNNYRSLPTRWGEDTLVSEESFDNRYSYLTPASDDYIDLWNKLTDEIRNTIYWAICYCPGEGISQKSLEIGKPRFPVITPLSFFWVPAQEPKIREFNPDGTPADVDCCTGRSPGEWIEAHTVEGEIQLTRHGRPDLEEIYRTDDVNLSFQAQAGYPRWCCIKNECADNCASSDTIVVGDSSMGIPSLSPHGQEFVKRWLHFPRWPGTDVRNPYDGCNPQEPLSLIPVVVDVQCDWATGSLYVYYANLIIYDGMISGLQWDANPPRGASSGTDPTAAPLNPEELGYNLDYQDRPIIQDFPSPIGDMCDNTCEKAGELLAHGVVPCTCQCPADSEICAENEQGYEVFGFGQTPIEAADVAFRLAIETTPLDCEPAYILCYSERDTPSWIFRAAVKFCCPGGTGISSAGPESSTECPCDAVAWDNGDPEGAGGCGVGIKNTYRISGFSGGLFVDLMCSSTIDKGPYQPDWNGELSAAASPPCRWESMTPVYINGYSVFATLEVVSDKWRLSIIEAGGTDIYWQGTKSGDTPEGSYSKIAGCADAGVIIIEG